VPAVVQRQQQRFLERWNEALGSAQAGPPSGLADQALQERALNEAAAYAIRIDVAEELTRLAPTWTRSNACSRPAANWASGWTS
jgi:uncharacterized protein YicC (UPF0701 family)